jgi:predicted DsbA family dithiol-disulfide isomerase
VSAPAGPGADAAAGPLRVLVHYDFASSICYVAHRVMQRMAPFLDELGVALDWSPLDLSRMGPFRPGARVPEERRANAARVADELGVAVRVPAVWPDARALGTAALLAEARGREASFRERAFSAVFEEGRRPEAAAEVAALGRELGLDLGAEDLAAAREALEARTDAAREAMVTGVPTFMLGSWPFGGIQTEETMRHVLTRFARRARERALA